MHIHKLCQTHSTSPDQKSTNTEQRIQPTNHQIWPSPKNKWFDTKYYPRFELFVIILLFFFIHFMIFKYQVFNKFGNFNAAVFKVMSQNTGSNPFKYRSWWHSFIYQTNLTESLTLMDELIKCVLSICPGFSPDDGSSLVITFLSTPSYVFSITLHITLLEVSCESVHVL